MLTLYHRGFTLLELLMTLTIVGIMIFLAVPTFSSLQKMQQINHITQSLNQTLDYARIQAITRNESILIEAKYHHNWQKGWLIKIKKDGTVLKSFSEMPLTITLHNKHHYIQIDTNGMTDGFQNNFEYGGRKLIINRGGRTRLE